METKILIERNYIGKEYIVDESGNLVVKYDYDAYGNIISKTGTLKNSIMYKGYLYISELGMYYCKSRFYVIEWNRFLNGDSINYLDYDNIDSLNLFSYCYNNPVMYSDGDGRSPEWWQWLLSGAMVIGGLALTICTAGIASGGLVGALATAGGILGGSMISAGAGSMLNGFISEKNGGSFTSGYWGGMISGAIAGASAGIGGYLLTVASSLKNGAMLLALTGSVAISFAGGFVGNLAGSKLTYSMDGKKCNMASLILPSLMNGSLNLCAGILSGVSGGISSTLNLSSTINTRIAVRIMAGVLSTGGEITNDLIALLIGVLL